MAVSSKYTQDLSVQIVFFTFSCKWFLSFYFWAVIWSYIVDLFAALHELASASARTLLKLASSVRALLKPYGDTLRTKTVCSKRMRRLISISVNYNGWVNDTFHTQFYTNVRSFPCGRTQHVRRMCSSIVSIIQSDLKFRFMRAIPHSRLNG